MENSSKENIVQVLSCRINLPWHFSINASKHPKSLTSPEVSSKFSDPSPGDALYGLLIRPAASNGLVMVSSSGKLLCPPPKFSLCYNLLLSSSWANLENTWTEHHKFVFVLYTVYYCSLSTHWILICISKGWYLTLLAFISAFQFHVFFSF